MVDAGEYMDRTEPRNIRLAFKVGIWLNVSVYEGTQGSRRSSISEALPDTYDNGARWGTGREKVGAHVFQN